MQVKINDSWKNILQSEFEKPYFQNLTNFVKSEYAEHTCYPKESDIFAAFNHCTFEDIKVVIIGQDPYHGAGQANGLCFSVYNNVKHPPSLRNIFIEIERDLGIAYPESGDLTRWAKQGVLLLNATLTVREGKANSHKSFGWKYFTDAVIQKISSTKKDVVFLLWGNFAQQKGKYINTEKHCVLKSGHPSPLSANKKKWFGNKHFSKTNTFLESIGEKVIQW